MSQGTPENHASCSRATRLISPSTAAIVVPLRSGGRAAKTTFKTDAALYAGQRDIDKLRLTCVSPAP